EGVQELPLRHGRLVQAVGHPVTLEVLQEFSFQQRVVVPIIERSCPREKIKIRGAVLAVEIASAGPVEHRGPGSAVTANLGFQCSKDVFHDPPSGPDEHVSSAVRDYQIKDSPA